MSKRQVQFSSLINLIKSKSPFSILGIVFTFISIFILLPIVFVISSQKESFEKYDFDKIKQNGKEINGKILNIEENINVSMNNRHPFVITYEFNENGQPKSDKFQTLDAYKIQTYKTGSDVQIISHNNESMIKGLEPFSFPFHFFFILPLIFLAIGIPFLLIGIIPALRNYELYKNGIVKDAKILSMTPNSGMPITNFGQSILVNYAYEGRTGKTILGKSSTTDFSILNEKKADEIVKIFISESNEEISCLIPKLESIKNNWKI